MSDCCPNGTGDGLQPLFCRTASGSFPGRFEVHRASSRSCSGVVRMLTLFDDALETCPGRPGGASRALVGGVEGFPGAEQGFEGHTSG